MSEEQTIICPNCQKTINPIKVPGRTIDEMGENIRQKALHCCEKYQIKCNECQTIFCINCKTFPFHEGLTCEEHSLIGEKIICRFCHKYPAIGCSELDNCHRVCWHQECKDNLSQACMTLCNCGHSCCGLLGESNHFGCAICNKLKCSICDQDAIIIIPAKKFLTMTLLKTLHKNGSILKMK